VNEQRNSQTQQDVQIHDGTEFKGTFWTFLVILRHYIPPTFILRISKQKPAISTALEPRFPEKDQNMGDDGDNQESPGRFHNDVMDEPFIIAEQILPAFGNFVIVIVSH
jgi:hypothetical protein